MPGGDRFAARWAAAGDRRGSVAAIAPVLLTMLPLSKLIERPTGMLR